MISVLSNCKREVISELVKRLSSANKDFELCLNAHLILLELADNDNCFGLLIQRECAESLINASCDIMNPNQGYAINVLQTILREFPFYANNLKDIAEDFQVTMGNHFLDITYSCLMVVRS